MHIRDIFEHQRTTCSFEFFPPKTPKGWERLFTTIRELEDLKPSFISVTYGAGGSTREQTHDLVLRIRRETNLHPIPHLTCVCHTAGEIQQILARYASEGVSNILALGGDPPVGRSGYDRSGDAFQHASDLVRFIRRYNESGAHPDARGFGIGVAGFPEGHPATPNRLTEMEHLRAKVDEGADYICSQLFFSNDDFYDWRDRCDLAGIHVPIIAGIMPVTSLQGMKRMAELAAGARYPAKLLRAIERCEGDDDAIRRVGVHWATQQCLDLLDNDVRGLHFYTLNQSDATIQIYRTLGLRDSDILKAEH
ncbi:methylenetetrahydrofolate reductase [NAD(P)H] [Candidatus Sumerlaeota bacterium]|nr:methylenetetrahydrofolate reductase [NAD(P)H] [Candidatus Sumerlaeota bacterium]